MSSGLFNLYWALVAAGFFLIAVEIFIPGGILGVLGVMSIIAAAILGFEVFGARYGFISALVLFVGGIGFVYLWIKYCPRSFFGKWFTLEADGKSFKSFDDRTNELAGKTGTAQTDLRPSGMALIDGHKVDVVTEAGFISRGSAVKVIQVSGGRVVVRQVE